MSPRIPIFLLILPVICGFFLAGCATTVGDGQSVGSYSYIQRGLETTYSRDIAVVFAAANQALQDLEIKVNNASQDQLAGRIDARDGSGEELTLEFESLGPASTKLTIQVGSLGNKNKTLRIYQQINANL